MPYVSDAELAALANTSSSDVSRPEPESVLGVVPLASSLGIAGVMGFVRSKLEDPSTGQWLVPGTQLDAEAALFALCAGVAFGGKYVGLGEWSRLASLGALGIGGHLMSEVGRNFGKTGQLSFTVGSGVPPWDPTSFDPTQLGNPYDDEQSQGLSSSGV